MRTEQIDLRNFIGETLERVGSAIPDNVVFSCQFEETPIVEADPEQLRAVLAELLSSACGATPEVRLKIGTVAGRSGPHAFIEVSQPADGGRIIVPVPVHRPSELGLAAASAAESD
jgi:signal transduction histidine kinase